MHFSITMAGLVISTLIGATVLIGAYFYMLPRRRARLREDAIRECHGNIKVAGASLESGDLARIRAIGGKIKATRTLMKAHGITHAELRWKPGALDILEEKVRELTNTPPRRMVLTPRAKDGAVDLSASTQASPRTPVTEALAAPAQPLRLPPAARTNAPASAAPASPVRRRFTSPEALLQELRKQKRDLDRRPPGPRSYGPLVPRGTILGGGDNVRHDGLFTKFDKERIQAAANAVEPAKSTSVTQPSMVPPPGSDRHAPPDIGGAGSERGAKPAEGSEEEIFVLSEISSGELDRLILEVNEPELAAPESESVESIPCELSDSFFKEEDPATVPLPKGRNALSSGVVARRDIGRSATDDLELDTGRDRISDHGPEAKRSDRFAALVGSVETAITGELTFPDEIPAHAGASPASGTEFGENGISQELEAVFELNFNTARATGS